MKINKHNLRHIYGALIFILILFLILINILISYNEKPLNENDIIKFKGTLTNIEETRIGGSRSYPIIFLNLKNIEPKFKISNASYDILAETQVKQYLDAGKEIEIGTTKEELLISKNIKLYDRIMNTIIDNRNNPQILFFKSENSSLFDIEKYNRIELERKKSNVIWGILFFCIGILIFGFIVYINWTTRFEY